MEVDTYIMKICTKKSYIMKICTKKIVLFYYWTVFNHYNNSPYSTVQGNYDYKMICLVRIATHSS